MKTIFITAAIFFIATTHLHAASLWDLYNEVKLTNTDISSVEIISGPTPANGTLIWGKSGTTWMAKSGPYEFKISIEEGAEKTIDDIIQMLEDMPQPNFRALERVSSVAAEYGLHIRKAEPGMSSGASGGDVILVNEAAAGEPWTLVHEAAHVLGNLEKYTFGSDVYNLWKEAIKHDSIEVNGYGNKNSGEDMAEFAIVYATCVIAGSDPRFENRTALEELKRLSPERVSLWERILYSDSPVPVTPLSKPGPDMLLTDNNNNGSESVTLDGSKSTGNIASYIWRLNSTTIATGPKPTVNLPVGDNRIKLMVTDENGSFDIAEVRVFVEHFPSLQSPYNGLVHNIPGKIEAEHYDEGGQGIAYGDLTPDNYGGHFRTDDVDIWPAPGTLNYKIGGISHDEWVEYTCNISESGIYTLTFNASTPNTNRSVDVWMNGSFVGNVSLMPSTGGYNIYDTFKLEGIPLQAGTNNILRLSMVGTGFDLDWMEFEKTAEAPTISSPLIILESKITLSAINTNNGTLFAINNQGETEIPKAISLHSVSGIEYPLTKTNAGWLLQQPLHRGVYLISVTNGVDRKAYKYVQH